MTIKSVLTFGCWMLLWTFLASALLSNPASADPNGLPQGIDPALLSGSEGSSGVISVNAPPQPLEPRRTKSLPPQPAGTIHLNAPSQRTLTRMDMPRLSVSGGIGGGVGRIR